MASIQVKEVTKTFKSVTAIDNLSLEIKDGEFFCILGPPGAGKTTLLRLIVGLEKPESGDIMIGGDSVANIHPSKRDISMIFQNLALYPDKTVFENIAFPLRQQKVPEDQIANKVNEVAKQLKIDWLLEKIPSKLSGGERQRVAIGRAIVRQPKAYLMDEPLSNLDALLRLEMRVALKELQTNLKETFIYVTHDQVEALSMGDRIAVLNHGVIQQVDVPEVIYRYPSNMFVATILGSPPMNFLPCNLKLAGESLQIHQQETFSLTMDSTAELEGVKIPEGGMSAELGIRPEDIIIHLEKPSGNSIPAEIYVNEPLGNETVVDIKLGENVIKVLTVPDFPGKSNQEVWVTMNTSKIHLFDETTKACIYHATEKDKIQIG